MPWFYVDDRRKGRDYVTSGDPEMSPPVELIRPLPVRLREAADTIEELNALHGLGLGEYVSPGYLRHTADQMERDTPEEFA